MSNYLRGILQQNEPLSFNCYFSTAQQPSSSSSSGSESSNDPYKRVCYFTTWSQYRQQNDLRYLPKHVIAAAHLCTHLVIAFGQIDPKTQRLKEESGAGRQLVLLKRMYPKLKILMSIGGWNNAGKGFVQVNIVP